MATERAERRLAAILAADVAGYSRLMGADEEGTHERLKAHFRQLIDPKIKEHRGRIVKNTGDGVLAEFSSAVNAMRCAVEIQRAMVDRNAEVTPDQQISFRVGINLGDVIVEENDIYGDGVNIAARLEGLAEPGGIWISHTVREQILGKLNYPLEEMGAQSVKNIARPVHAYAVNAAGVASLPRAALPAQPIVNTREAAEPAVRPTPRLSIVVLPFVNLSNDPEQEYFADGITDDLTTDLSRISDSFVIARNTAFTYKGKSVDVKQIGRELGVRYVLEGSIRQTGEQVRINAQLVDAKTGAHLWADRFDTDRRNLPESQNAITTRLARTLNREIVGVAAQQIEKDRDDNPEAHDLVIRGWDLFYRPASVASREEAQRAFEKALEIDPRSVGAKIGLATILAGNLTFGWSGSTERDEAKAEQLLVEVIEGGGRLSMAHYAMGILRRFQNRMEESKIELETAIALDGNNAHAVLQLGHTLLYSGQPEAAIGFMERALCLNPRDPRAYGYYYILGASHLLLDNVDKAIEFLRKACAANPQLPHHHLFLAGALGLRGNLDEAKSALAEAIRLRPEVNSIARFRALVKSASNAQYWALREKTVNIGLRRAGFPEE